MEKILLYSFLLLILLYYNYNYYNYNIYNQEENSIQNNSTIIYNGNYQYETLPSSLIPEYKYSLPLIYFLFIVRQ